MLNDFEKSLLCKPRAELLDALVKGHWAKEQRQRRHLRHRHRHRLRRRLRPGTSQDGREMK